MFVLELFQAGVSWELLLRKRENFRSAFDNFDAEKIAAYGPEKIDALMQDPGIIRNRRKIEAAIGNARVVLKLREEFGSFSNYLWHFTETTRRHLHRTTISRKIACPAGETTDDHWNRG